MSKPNRYMPQNTVAGRKVDEGLRAYLLKVFNYMTLGLALTGVVAFFVSTSPAMLQAIFGTPLKWVVLFAPLGLVLLLSFRIQSLSPAAAQGLFWVYAAAMGLSLSTIFIAYTGASIARVFFITAATFGSMSLWGYTTRRDLSGFGSFLFMGLIGLVIASIVNLFLKSSGFDFVLSVLGVLIFTGLTAYDMQNIKQSYYAIGDAETAEKMSIMGALQLYLDFINLFLSLLRLMGDRR